MSRETRTELEKSSLPSARQLDEAAAIAGIQISDAEGYAEVDAIRRQKSQSYVKEEWTLRWLLKKLKSPEFLPVYTLNPRTWILLRSLVQRIPSKNVARHFTENEFMQSLEAASTVLDENAGLSGENRSEAAKVGEEASSSLSFPSRPDGRSRKRKRSTTEASVGDPTVPNALLAAIRCINFLLNLIRAEPSRPAAQFGMRALRSDARSISSMLGHLIRATNKCLSVPNSFCGREGSQELVVALSSILGLWGFRSQSKRDGADQESNVRTLL